MFISHKHCRSPSAHASARGTIHKLCLHGGGDKKGDIDKGGCVDSVPNKDKGEEIQIPGAGVQFNRHL